MLSSQFGLRTFIVIIVHVNAVLGRIGPVADMTVSNKFISPDGFGQTNLLAGGTFPGPLVTGIKGDTFKINVINSATDAQAIAVQWHGISHQTKNTNWADGTPHVTQCPIIPGRTFEYEFAADQAGDFSYRAHSTEHHIDGVRGPLIVYDPEDPHSSLYDVDDESTVVTLTDHYHADAGVLMNSYLTGATKGDIPTPAGGLINGKGRYLSGPASELPVINVQPSKRYRFRVINIGTATPFQFSIDEHKLTVIAVDGTPVRPYTVDRLRIDVGQRYSVVMIANQAIRNYWTRAVMDTNCFADASTVDPVVKAVLRYKGAPNADPTTTPKAQYDDLKQVDLHPLVSTPAPGSQSPGGVEKQVVLNVAYNQESSRWTVNEKSWEAPNTPTLLAVLNGQKTFPSQMVIDLPSMGQSVELVVNNNYRCPQAFHLHGYKFHVVSEDGKTYNYVDPVIRDTVTVAANGKAVLRFTASHAGVWAFHAQNEWYRQAGLLAPLMSMPEEIANVGFFVPAEKQKRTTFSLKTHRVYQKKAILLIGILC